MKLKTCILLLIFVFGYESLANAIVDRSNFSNNSSISKSSIVRSSIYENDEITQDYGIIIEDLLEKIQATPDNYSLYIQLIDAYIKSQNYHEALDKLMFLVEEKSENKLSEENKQEINQLYHNIAEYSKYKKNKSSIFVNLGALALLNDDYPTAEKYIKNSIRNITDQYLVLLGINYIYSVTENYNEAISACNLLASLNKSNVNSIKKLKIYYFIKDDNLNAALIEYKELCLKGDDIGPKLKYELFKTMSKNNFSEKKIAETLFSQYGKDINKSYYALYNLLLEEGDNEYSSIYAKIIKKEFPDSLTAKFFDIENMINNNKKKEAFDALNSIRAKITTEQDITTFNRLLLLLSKDPIFESVNLINKGYYKQALDILNSGNIIETEIILSLKARCCMELGRMQEAIEYLNKAYAYNQNTLLVNLQFGYYYFYNSDYITSRKYSERALQLAISDEEKDLAYKLIDKLNEIESGVYINQIISAFDSQNYKESMRLTDEALAIDPKSSILYYYKGINYIAQNNYAASTAALYKAIELDENNALAYYYLGIAFDNLSEQKNALSCYENFIKLLPQDEYQENEKVEYAKNRIQKIKRTK